MPTDRPLPELLRELWHLFDSLEQVCTARDAISEVISAAASAAAAQDWRAALAGFAAAAKGCSELEACVQGALLAVERRATIAGIEIDPDAIEVTQ